MNNRDILTLSITSNAFDSMKKDFDKVLKRTLGNMQVKESDEAVLTMKLSITLTETEVPDWDAPSATAMKTIHKPRFDHKISSVMKIKTEESGSLKGEYELVWDDDTQDYVMKPIDNGQRSFYDNDFVCPEETDKECDNQIKQLPKIAESVELDTINAASSEAESEYDYEDDIMEERFDEAAV